MDTKNASWNATASSLMTSTDDQMICWSSPILTSQTAKNQLSLSPMRRRIFAGLELLHEIATDPFPVNNTTAQKTMKAEG
jgi:hypothetical protein